MSSQVQNTYRKRWTDAFVLNNKTIDTTFLKAYKIKTKFNGKKKFFYYNVEYIELYYCFFCIVSFVYQ